MKYKIGDRVYSDLGIKMVVIDLYYDKHRGLRIVCEGESIRLNTDGMDIKPIHTCK